MFFVCAFLDVARFHSLEEFLKGCCGVIKVKGKQFEFINLCITQFKYGISFDQTDHIIDTNVNYHFFPPHSTEHLKKVHTPFQMDSKFEPDLAEQLPATHMQLCIIEKQYRGTFPEIMGTMMHVYVWSHNDLGFCCPHLDCYIQAPNKASFKGLLRVVRYLGTHRNHPVMYPIHSIEKAHNLRVDFDPQKLSIYPFPMYLTYLCTKLNEYS